MPFQTRFACLQGYLTRACRLCKEKLRAGLDCPKKEVPRKGDVNLKAWSAETMNYRPLAGPCALGLWLPYSAFTSLARHLANSCWWPRGPRPCPLPTAPPWPYSRPCVRPLPSPSPFVSPAPFISPSPPPSSSSLRQPNPHRPSPEPRRRRAGLRTMHTSWTCASVGT